MAKPQPREIVRVEVDSKDLLKFLLVFHGTYITRGRPTVRLTHKQIAKLAHHAYRRRMAEITNSPRQR